MMTTTPQDHANWITSFIAAFNSPEYGTVIMLLKNDGRIAVFNDEESVDLYAGYDLDAAIMALRSQCVDVDPARVRTIWANWHRHRNTPYRAERERRRNERVNDRMRQTLSWLIAH